MRLYSTRESYNRGEYSVLAIVETLIAFALTLWVACRLHGLDQVLLLSLLGWLFLLQSERSVRLGLEGFRKEVEATEKEILTKRQRGDVLSSYMESIFYDIVRAVISPLYYRASATIRTALTHPLLSIRSIPSNWERAIFCADSTLPLEPVPGYYESVLAAPGGQEALEKARSRILDVRYKTLAGELKNPRVAALTIIAGCACLLFAYLFATGAPWYAAAVPELVALWGLCKTPLRILLYVPVIAYRFTLKSTCLIYWPLLFSAHALSRNDPLELRLESTARGVWATMRLCLSAAVLLTIVGKVVFWSYMVLIEQHADSPVISFLIHDYLQPTIHGWQLASLVNAVLAITMVVVADNYLRRQKYGVAIPRAALGWALNVYSILAAALSVWTILATVQIVLRRGPFVVLPQFGKWFPD
jgi:hypothetical protein